RDQDLEIDLQAAELREFLFDPANQSRTNAPATAARLDGERVDPAAVAVVATHDGSDDLFLLHGDEEQVRLVRQLAADAGERIVVRSGIRKHTLPKADDGGLVLFRVSSDLHFRK